ncbi:transposase [Xanthomonas phaseoli]
MAVKDICRQVGISTATYCQWKSKYGSLGGFGAAAGQGA